ncbi:hypothetical protein O7626_02300 [Micromonospora sp. WMMD1102]|uniref:hypothetical protein n=1 Tax=Micromonospora sp. WMMD1102 TaxID=3016105 RepID=UPI0024152939|nr:hypothetical protein [Micromonospora sp. WMMD1102]MDG4784773.1 hypothetical protein [Micromonospora sp. WMMD1102]
MRGLLGSIPERPDGDVPLVRRDGPTSVPGHREITAQPVGEPTSRDDVAHGGGGVDVRAD